MEQIIPSSSSQYIPLDDLGIVTKGGGESHKSKRSDDCCKSVLSGDAVHMDSQTHKYMHKIKLFKILACMRRVQKCHPHAGNPPLPGQATVR